MSDAPPPTDEPPFERLHLWQFQFVRDILVIGGFVLLIMVGYWLRAVTVPLLIAIALAYLVEPIVARLSSQPRLSRPLVVGGMLATLGTIGAILMVTVLPLVVLQTIDLVQELPENVRRLSVAVEEYIHEDYVDEYREFRESILPPRRVDSVEAEGGDVAPVDEDVAEVTPTGEALTPAQAWLRANIGAIFRTTIGATGEALDWFVHLLGGAIYIAFLLFLIPFYFFSFSVSWPSVRRFFRRLVPQSNAEQINDILAKMDRAISGFVRGRILISLIMGVLLAIGWGIVGVPYWMLVGLITGVFCAVPYLGGVGLPVAVVLLWVREVGQPVDERMVWWAIVLWPTVVFVIVQLIEGYILTPLIAGKQTNLGPVSILVAVLAGGAVAGVYGMLLAIPVAACAKILITEVWLPRVHEWTEGRAPDILPFGRD